MEEELGLLSVGGASIAEVGRGYRAPVDLIGLLRLRGALCPVIDIRGRLGLSVAVAHIGECIVVLHSGGMRIGLLVESIEGVVAPPTNQADRPVDEHRLIRGVSEVAGHVVATLDAEAVVGNDVRTFLAASAQGLHNLAGRAAAA